MFVYKLNFLYHNPELIFNKEFKDPLPLNKLISYFKDLAEIKFNLDVPSNITEKELLQSIKHIKIGIVPKKDQITEIKYLFYSSFSECCQNLHVDINNNEILKQTANNEETQNIENTVNTRLEIKTLDQLKNKFNELIKLNNIYCNGVLKLVPNLEKIKEKNPNSDLKTLKQKQEPIFLHIKNNLVEVYKNTQNEKTEEKSFHILDFKDHFSLDDYLIFSLSNEDAIKNQDFYHYEAISFKFTDQYDDKISYLTLNELLNLLQNYIQKNLQDLKEDLHFYKLKTLKSINYLEEEILKFDNI